MNILTVSNDAGLLAALSGVLEELFPDAAITRGTDPLMAGKYAFHHEVDILLADVDMKRMDGIQLIHFSGQLRVGHVGEARNAGGRGRQRRAAEGEHRCKQRGGNASESHIFSSQIIRFAAPQPAEGRTP